MSTGPSFRGGKRVARSGTTNDPAVQQSGHDQVDCPGISRRDIEYEYQTPRSEGSLRESRTRRDQSEHWYRDEDAVWGFDYGCRPQVSTPRFVDPSRDGHTYLDPAIPRTRPVYKAFGTETADEFVTAIERLSLHDICSGSSDNYRFSSGRTPIISPDPLEEETPYITPFNESKWEPAEGLPRVKTYSKNRNEPNCSDMIVRAILSQEGSQSKQKDVKSRAKSDLFSFFATGSWIDNNDASTTKLELEDITSGSGAHAQDLPRFADLLEPAVAECASGSKGVGSGTQGEASQVSNVSGSGSAGSEQSPTNRGGKNPKRASNDEENEGDKGQDSSKKVKRDKPVLQRFACPFFKHDPGYYRTAFCHSPEDKYMACGAGFGYENIARLKEHLSRVHLLPYSCSRCRKEFDDVDDLRQHERLEDRTDCPVLPRVPPKGMTRDAYSILKDRGKKGRQTEKEKWWDIYHLLLPGTPDPISGPYKDDLYLISMSPPPSRDSLGFSRQELVQHLSKRLNITLREPTPVAREHLKQFILGEVEACIAQLSTSFCPENTTTPRHTPSISSASQTESGYGSLPKCGDSECRSECMHCVSMSTPEKDVFDEVIVGDSSRGWMATEEGYVDPSMLVMKASSSNLGYN